MRLLHSDLIVAHCCLQIDKFSLEQSKDPARPGRQLLLPSALHSRAPKVSTATDGGAVHVWDWAVHPDALQEAAQQPSLMDMMSVIVSIINSKPWQY